MNNRFSYLCVIALCVSVCIIPLRLHSHGFAIDTPIVVCAKQGTVYLSDVCWRNVKHWRQWCIASYDTQTATYVHGKVIHVGASVTPSYIRLMCCYEKDTCIDVIIASPFQEFYLYSSKEWIPAYRLTSGMQLASLNGYNVVIAVEHVIEKRELFLIEVQDTHTFFVGGCGILTHNMALPYVFNLGLSIPFGIATGSAAGSFFGPVTILTGAAIGCAIGFGVHIVCGNKMPQYEMASYDTKSFSINKKHSNLFSSMGGGSDPNGNNNNDDEDDKDEDEPFGKYTDAPYHHPNSKGRKSACPDNGQDALNNSIQSPNLDSKRRYGVSSSGQFITFDQTMPGLYHGHIVSWNELGDVMGLQKEMVKQRLATKKGKAIKRIAKKIMKGF